MKLRGFAARRARSFRRSESVIVFTVGGTTFAIAAAAVEEIRGPQGLRPLTCEAAHSSLAKVRHTLQRAHKTFLVVDAALHFQTPRIQPTRVLILRNSTVAVAVDGIDRMAEIHALYPLPAAFRGDERRWYRGLALIGEAVVPVVQPDMFLTRAEQMVVVAAAAAAQTKTQTQTQPESVYA
ncbi:MAG: chemotaxis protein CheW [Terriglobales bacterium]